MEDQFEHVVYSKNVIEFVTVANELVLLLERGNEFDRNELMEELQKLLPLLYIKAVVLPDVESVFDDANEKFVTEHDWSIIQQILQLYFSQFFDNAIISPFSKSKPSWHY